MSRPGRKATRRANDYEATDTELGRVVAALLSRLAARLPRPCSRCGWQYGTDKLLAAARGEMTLDPTPTHLCKPQSTE